jgi:hypothetical protein
VLDGDGSAVTDGLADGVTDGALATVAAGGVATDDLPQPPAQRHEQNIRASATVDFLGISTFC